MAWSTVLLYHANVLYPYYGFAQSLGAYETAILALSMGGRHAKAVLLLGDVEAAGLVLREEVYGEVIRACCKVRKVVRGEGSLRPMRSIDLRAALVLSNCRAAIFDVAKVYQYAVFFCLFCSPLKGGKVRASAQCTPRSMPCWCS